MADNVMRLLSGRTPRCKSFLWLASYLYLVAMESMLLTDGSAWPKEILNMKLEGKLVLELLFAS